MNLGFLFATECNDSCGQFELIIVFNIELSFGQFGETHIFMVDPCFKVNIILFNLMKSRYNAFLVVL